MSRWQDNEMKKACPEPEVSGFIRYRSRLRLSTADLCKMLDNSDTDELDLDDYNPEGDFESKSVDSSGEENEARSREIGRGIQPGWDEPQINLANEQLEYWK